MSEKRDNFSGLGPAMERTKFQCAARGCDGCVVCTPVPQEPCKQCGEVRSHTMHDAEGWPLYTMKETGV